MIITMALAQLRANKTFTLWTAGLMSLLVAILTYLVIAGTTQASIGRDEDRLRGYDRESHVAMLLIVTGAGPRAMGEPVSEVTAAIDASVDHSALAVADDSASTTPLSMWTAPDWGSKHGLNVRAVRGATGDEPVVVDGAFPAGLGEIALAWDRARDMGVNIGDTLPLYTQDWSRASQSLISSEHQMRVVGLMASTTLAGYELSIPDGYVSWEEATSPGGLLVHPMNVVNGEDISGSSADVHWNGSDPALQKFASPAWNWQTGSQDFLLPQASLAWFGAAVVLFVAMIVMAFAVGRSQASARTQWVATARAMGARRSYIAGATVIETALLGVFAMVVGTALGIGVSAAQLGLARGIAHAPFGPSTISLSWTIAPVVVAVTTLVAIVIAAVPAFWASRVSPTAALKPVADVTEAEISRRVPLSWAVAPFLVGVGLVALGSSIPPAPMLGVVALGWVAVAIGGFVVVIEVLRGVLPAFGRVLSSRSDPAVMSAGDEIASRPRQAVAPALLLTVGVGFFTAFTLSAAQHEWSWGNLSGDYPASPGDLEIANLVRTLLTSTTVTTFVIAAVTLELVAIAIFISHRVATSHEAAARRAMGLSHADETRALWWQQWLPQAMGAVTGLVVGGVSVLGYITMGSLTGTNVEDPLGPSLAPGMVWVISAGVAIVAALAMLVLAAFGSWLSARFRASETPIAVSGQQN